MKKSALLTVFLVVLVDLMGFGIVLPLIPFYAAKFNASAISIGLLYSIYSLAQLVFSPLWGSFSDRIGRRPIMLMSTFGAVLAYLLFAFSNSLPLLFLSRLIAGIMGGNISTAQAYVADVTPPEERAKGMGLIGAAFGIGFTVGPAIATLLIHHQFHEWLDHLGFSHLSSLFAQNKYALPGLFAAFLSFSSFLLVLFQLPETVKKKSENDPSKIVKVSLFSKRFWQTLTRENQSSKHHLISILMLSVFLLSFAQSSLYSAFPLFCKTILLLSPEKVGMQFATMGLIAVFIQGGLIRPLEKKFGERPLFLAGNMIMITGLALIPFASSEKMLTVFLSLMAIGGSLNGPTLNSLISKEADPAQIGATMGTSQGLSALGRVVGPTWGGALFSASFRSPFIATALIASLTVYFGWKLQEQK